MKLQSPFRLAILAAGLIISISLLSACNVTNQNTTTKKMSVSMQVVQSSANKATPTTQAVDSVALDNIKLLVKKLELKSEGEGEFENEQEGESHEADEGEQGDDNEQGEEFELSNQIFDLPLDGNKVSVSTGQIPTGTYRQVEVEIGPAEEGSDIQDTTLVEGNADSLRYSMAIHGTAGGNEFTFKTHKEFEVEIPLNPAVEVTDTTQSANIDLTVDPSDWFKDPETGDYLDPNDPDNHNVIESNIAHSFKANYHEEGDHDEDHHENGNDEDGEDHED